MARLDCKDNRKGMLETETENVHFCSLQHTYLSCLHLPGEGGTICMLFVQTNGETQYSECATNNQKLIKREVGNVNI